MERKKLAYYIIIGIAGILVGFLLSYLTRVGL